MFTEVLARAGVSVCVVDPSPPAATPPGVRWVDGDIRAPGDAVRAEVSRAELLLLAVPEPVAVAAVPVLADLLPEKALLADTLSVKERMATALRGFPDRQAVSLNPMFAPALGMRGRPVVSVVFHDGPLVDELLELVGESGGRVVRMEALQHDRLAAISQALTHATVLAFGHALHTLDADVEELIAVAPPPHATLLALLARIASGTPEVYWDVQSGNPLVSDAHDALAGGVEHVRNIVRSSNGADFERLLLDVGDVLGGRLQYLQGMCAQLFANTALVDSEERA
ncbi:prephenate dehydrogenase dimerization domain-containing protein [Lentzea sp. BCCO 10_0061]|uniref:Prephenate dehydrogenase dimerization domain-containing protein n=1 Tax=Lentzea sokolovensis TaxID=3095429 RepID=A0ABU4VDE1_9PSEU|nr:prephenate dehydrogenase dimerization domain-containing protein [Lentzea sp. BCCO 10_0061]MDX8148910.1 prephenate dehydrogenase dimerization domain-containing protein [Lentzea sp. BCCO 10_0061]